MSKPREALDAYYAEAGSWANSRQDELQASRWVAWRVAAAACVVAVCEALALLFLMPLKRVEPYTLMVDRQTGYVQLLKPLNPEIVSSDAALTQSFLVQYVIAREGFDINALQADYRKVALWSAGGARADYLATMPASNPASPLAMYPRSSVVDVRVKSVTSLGKTTALVRFDTLRKDLGRQAAAPRAWVAVVRYGYSGQPMTMEDRLINPLGFQVQRYRRSAEALASEAQPAQTATATNSMPQPQGAGGAYSPPISQPILLQAPRAQASVGGR